MMDKLDELEKRVVEFLDRHRQSRKLIDEARAENEQLRQKLGNHDALVEENRVLREKIRTLEGEIAALNDKEGEIRGRLTSILERIALLETEIQESGRVTG
jgi:chromosome segregation ATPase